MSGSVILMISLAGAYDRGACRAVGKPLGDGRDAEGGEAGNWSQRPIPRAELVAGERVTKKILGGLFEEALVGVSIISSARRARSWMSNPSTDPDSVPSAGSSKSSALRFCPFAGQ